ncbi:ABC-type branched-subunit amino acid transport system ATPase component/ABC-type branched-subunit amino acid transport system permease subunit [Variovorax sp. OAS795]|uniref:branched-chain amino acid ABC transporter ATP-binding protein/permease n=1 Tax=Variovorax sp. OAS795 TaxID=3034231 RepID=UPI0033984838
MSIRRASVFTAAVAALAAIPLFTTNPYYIHLLVVIGIYAILLFGMDVVVGYTGEVSLGHAGLFGIGAYAAGLIFMKLGLPFWVGLIAAIGITAAFGLLLALPALRVTGPYLAMVTLAFGTILAILFNEMDFLTSGPQGLVVAKPSIFGIENKGVGFYYFTLAMSALCWIGVTRLLKSHFGRAFIALRGSPIAADCMGVSVYKYKVVAFVISAAMAGLAGGMFAFSEGYIAPNNFTAELAILFLLALTLGGRRSRIGSVLGAAVIVVLPNLLSDIALFRMLAVTLAVVITGYAIYRVASKGLGLLTAAIPVTIVIGMAVLSFTLTDISERRLTIFGLLILGVVYYMPDGIVGFIRSATKGLRAKPKKHAVVTTSVVATPSQAIQATTSGWQGAILQAKGVVMQFGGLKAVNQLDMVVEQGAVHGLIGPNGSGKSTMMNVLTGIYAPTSGDVVFEGNRINGNTPSSIALGGIARTFQNVQLFGDMSATENILVGLHHTFKSTLLDVVLHTRRYRDEEAAALQRAQALLDFVGLSRDAEEEARNLPYGRMRLLEIARALSLGPRLLLLDEPAAGLPPAELPDLVQMIRKIKEHGVAVILIEHHMDVVMSICDQVTVLDFGQKIAEGTGSEVRSNPKVVEAYLGAEVVHEPKGAGFAPAMA